MHTRSRIRTLGSCLVAIAVFATACGDSTTDTTTSTTVPETATGESVTTTTLPSTTTLATTTTTTATTTTTTMAVPSTTTTTIVEEPIELDSVVEVTRAGAGWLVEPGTYVSDMLSRTVVFRMTDAVSYLGLDRLAFGEVDVVWEQLDIVIITEFVGVLPADEAGVHPDHDPPVPENTEPLPDDLGEWLDAVPQLVVIDSGSRMVDGEPALYWDVEVDKTLGDTFPCQFRDCVATFVDDLGFFVMGDGARFRVLQLSGNGEGVYVWVQSGRSGWDATIALSDQLLDGLMISPAG